MAKKMEVGFRFCCDFRCLNAVTIKDAYPIPRIDESLTKLGDAKIHHDVGFGFCLLACAAEKTGSRENGLRV